VKIVDFWQYRQDHDPTYRDDAPVDAAWELWRPVVQQNPRTLEDVERDLAEARAYGIEQALRYIGEGRRGRALYELVRSVQRQAVMAGLGTPAILPVSLQEPSGWWER